MTRYEYDSQHELLQYITGPDRRRRVNHALLEENPELAGFAATPANIEWLAPDRSTGKALKDSARNAVGLRGPSPQATK